MDSLGRFFRQFSRFNGWLALGFGRWFGFDQLTGAPELFNLGPGRRAESMRFDGQFAGQFAIAQNLDALYPSLGQARSAQSGLIHGSAFVEIVQRLQINRDVANGEARIVEAALGNAADQWHLAALKSDANGTARTGRLAFAAPSAGLAVAAGFTLAEAFAAVLGAGAWFEIV